MSFSQDSQGFPQNPQSNSFKLDEVGLPKSTLWNFIKEVLAENNVKGEKAICPLIDKITIHYINYLSSLGSSICLKNGKKTLNIEHILEALKEMHFEKHIKSITNEPYFNENNNSNNKVIDDSDNEKKNYDVMNVKQLINKKKKRSNKRKKYRTEEDLEELAREQKEMFENARREQMNKNFQMLNNQVNESNNDKNNLINTNNNILNNNIENNMNSNMNNKNEKKEENSNKNNNINKYEDIFANNEQEDNFD